MAGQRRTHIEWVLMADRGVPIETIARLNGRKPDYVRAYIRRRGDELRGGPAPLPLFLHDHPQPRPANLPDPDRRWQARLVELASFLSQYQRRPHASRKDPNRGANSEWALAHWLIVQRTEERKGRLPEHRGRALERVLPSWRIDDRTIEYEASWRLRLVELKRFTAEHGRSPSRENRGIPGEKGLAIWLKDQDRRYRDGTLDPERKAWLDRQVPGWRGERRAKRDAAEVRARARAQRVVDSVRRTMSLEGQGLSPEAITRIYERTLREQLSRE